MVLVRGRLAGLALVALLAGTRMVAAGEPELFRHDLWDRVLRSYVTPAGQVHYRELKAHSQDLEAYVRLLGRFSPENAPAMFPSRSHRLAYWINAYNALIVRRVVRHYPVGSIRDLGGLMSSVFKKKQPVGGRRLSYDDIEHKIIRRRFGEPRIHFVLNCASRSCAPLEPFALTAENLEATLEQAARRFLNDPRNVRIDPGSRTVWLSRYFDWFKGDFLTWLRREKKMRHPRVLDYVLEFLDPPRRRLLDSQPVWRVRFLKYDWSLNQARGAGEG